MAVFFAIVRWSKQPRGWWGSLVIFLLSGVGIATAGLLGTRWFTMKFDFLTPITDRLPIRITGLPGAAEGFHPNEVAGSLLWILPVFGILSMMILSGRGTFPGKSPRLMKWFINIVILGLTGFIAAVFVLTQSRGGYIALALTLLILCILSLPKWSRLVLLIGGAVVAGSVGFWWMTSPSNPVFLQATQQTGLLTGPLSVGSFVARMEIWSRAIYGIQDFPFTGMGMNTFRRVVQLLYPLFSFPPDMDIGHAHNEFLQAGLDLGIPGLVGFIGINLLIFWMLIQTWRISHKRIDGACSNLHWVRYPKMALPWPPRRLPGPLFLWHNRCRLPGCKTRDPLLDAAWAGHRFVHFGPTSSGRSFKPRP